MSRTRASQTLLLLAGLSSLAVSTPSSVHATAAPAPRRAPALAGALVAVALRGDIYVIPAGGGAPRRLTAYGLNSGPRLSSDGRTVAYLSTARRYIARGVATTHSVWLVPTDGRPDGSDARRLTPANPVADRGDLAWSPDGRLLAYDEGHAVVMVDPATGRCAVVFRRTATPAMSGSAPAIAWSPDGQRIALMTSAGPQHAAVAQVDISSGTTITTPVRFPASPPAYAEIGRSLGWTADGRHLVLDVSRVGEGGGVVVGLWQVALPSGAARLVAGSLALPVGKAAPPAPAVDNATDFALSPDGRRLATDPFDEGVPGKPSGALWVARSDGADGHLYDLGPATNACALTQFSWLPDSTGLAYVTSCIAGGNGMLRERLGVLPLDGGNSRPHPLYSLTGRAGIDGVPGLIDLAPPARFVGGGGL